ncbi:uncharacterized protein BXZ73DRAFT_105733 [Epithele typhae]|uniref:uncharacterized protein n=1 Tax=Epithele typhae TaxID=378194 RepID=UPI002007262A|nr:uncharacterized protein BXZ73DRAFT_105733 [Epithele typhae]KAH9916755.1 hypothetical protein BXZ73DRAFT_105733 [Epithele typhae]
MLTFLSLYEDVLLEICSYLTSRDALQLSLAHSSLYPLAMPRALAHRAMRKEKTKPRLSRFRRSMIRTDERLPLLLPIYYVRSLDLRGIVEVEAWRCSNILSIASRLLELSLSHVYLNLFSFADVLPTLPQLTTLILEGCVQNTILSIAEISIETLESLSLQFTDQYAHRSLLMPFKPQSFIGAFAHFPRLRDLTLLNANAGTLGAEPDFFWEDLGSPGSPVLPSIRRLSLHIEGFILETLLSACRNLTDLVFRRTHAGWNRDFSTVGPPWPSPLRTLTWDPNCGLYLSPESEPRIPRAHHLVLHNKLHVRGETADIYGGEYGAGQALVVLGRVNPVVVSMTVYPTKDKPPVVDDDRLALWPAFAHATPRLRALELTMNIRGDDGMMLLPCLRAAFRALPKLAYLGLDVPPATGRYPKGHARDLDPTAQGEFFTELTLARRYEAYRLDVLKRTVERGAGALPGLVVLRIAHLQPPFRSEAEKAGAPGAGDEGINQAADEALEKLRDVAKDANKGERWWRPEGEGVERRFVEISREEGERLRELVQNTDERSTKS